MAKSTGWSLKDISKLTIEQINLFSDAAASMSFSDMQFKASCSGAKLRSSMYRRQFPPGVVKYKLTTVEDKMVEDFLHGTKNKT